MQTYHTTRTSGARARARKTECTRTNANKHRAEAAVPYHTCNTTFIPMELMSNMDTYYNKLSLVWSGSTAIQLAWSEKLVWQKEQ